jgi:hypothetical protein
MRAIKSDCPVVPEGKQSFKLFDVRVAQICLVEKIPIVERDESKGRGKEDKYAGHRLNAMVQQERHNPMWNHRMHSSAQDSIGGLASLFSGIGK